MFLLWPLLAGPRYFVFGRLWDRLNKVLFWVSLRRGFTQSLPLNLHIQSLTLILYVLRCLSSRKGSKPPRQTVNCQKSISLVPPQIGFNLIRFIQVTSTWKEVEEIKFKQVEIPRFSPHQHSKEWKYFLDKQSRRKETSDGRDEINSLIWNEDDIFG